MVKTRSGDTNTDQATRYVPRASEDCGAFGALPDEVVVLIGGNLGARDLKVVSLLSRRFGLDRGPMDTHQCYSKAWSSLAEQCAKCAYLHRHEFFRGHVALQYWNKPRDGREGRSSYLVTLDTVDGFAGKICIQEAGPDAMISGASDMLRAARASRFVCRPRKAPYPGTQRVEFTLTKSGQGGARIGIVAWNSIDYAPRYVDWQKIDDGEDGSMDIREERTWLFDTASGCLVHSDPRDGPGARVTERPWGRIGGTDFVKEGSVIGMELGRPGTESSYFMTIAIDIDGRRLGQLITPDEPEENEIGLIPSWPRTLRWCGVASAGAELRIDGPKPPASD